MSARGWIGLLLLAVSEILMFRRIEPFHSWFYSFAWWSYILIADSVVLRLRGRSMLHDRLRELPRMLALSVFIWLVFEACNLRLRNWSYTGLPPEAWLRWPGYLLAFATVLPGIFISSDLLEALVVRWRGAPCASEAEPRVPGKSATSSIAWPAAGIGLTAAALVLPRYFFPAIWVGPIFIFDPLLERCGLQSLSLPIAAGQRRRVWSLLLGGAGCGLLWEFWNFWAGSKWVYSIPFFGGWKLFEMPALGFLGFPPFALECWILYHWLSAQERRHGGWFWAAIALYCAWALWAIDHNTVTSYLTRQA